MKKQKEEEIKRSKKKNEIALPLTGVKKGPGRPPKRKPEATASNFQKNTKVIIVDQYHQVREL